MPIKTRQRPKKRTKRGPTLIFGAVAILLLWAGALPSGANFSQNCLDSCIRSHPKWGHPFCSDGFEFYIVGKGCYEIQNDCALMCGVFLDDDGIALYVPSPQQVTNLWRHKNTCSPKSQKMPIDRLPGTHVVEPDWQGQCECLNGRLVLGLCGHKRLSCNAVCDLGKSF